MKGEKLIIKNNDSEKSSRSISRANSKNGSRSPSKRKKEHIKKLKILMKKMKLLKKEKINLKEELVKEILKKKNLKEKK